MFDKLQQLKKLKQLRDQAIEMQKKLREESVTVEEGKIRIVMNGAQEIEELTINGEDQKEIREAVGRALKKSQEVAARRLQQMGGGLSGLLGG